MDLSDILKSGELSMVSQYTLTVWIGVFGILADSDNARMR